MLQICLLLHTVYYNKISNKIKNPRKQKLMVERNEMIWIGQLVCYRVLFRDHALNQRDVLVCMAMTTIKKVTKLQLNVSECE